MANPGPKPVSIPWWLPGSLFLLVTVILFGEFIFSDGMLEGVDTLSLGYMARAFFAEQLVAGDFPLWSPRLLGGIPSIEALAAGDAVYPTSLLYYLTDPHRVLGWKLVLHVLGGGFFMYGWARSLGLGRPAATVGGLAWLMAPVMVTLVLGGNDGKLMVASLTPLVFWAAESVLRRPTGRTGAGLAGAVALTCLTTQFQTAYFLFMSVGAYAVFQTMGTWRAGQGNAAGADGHRRRLPGALAPMGTFLGCALLGAGLAAFQLLPAFQYVGEYSRRVATTVDATPEEAIAYSSSWSYHPEEVVSLAVPEFVGNSGADADWAQGTYWGRNALKLNHEYLGVTVLVVALFGMLGRKRRGLRWFMAVLGLLWLLFALGTHTPVWRAFYEVVPGISLFRVPAIAAFLVNFGAVTLFTLGIEDLVRESPSPGTFLAGRRGRVLLGFLGLLLLGLVLQASGVLGSMWTSAVYTVADPRKLAALAAATPFITRGFAIALLTAGLTFAAMWAVKEGRVSLTAGLAALALLVAVDLGRIDRAYIGTRDFHAWAAPTANTRFLEQRRDTGAEAPFRVADLRRGGENDQNVDLGMYGLDIIAGHHPNDLARYRNLLGLVGSQHRGANTTNPNVLRMMNVRYLVASGTLPPGAQPVSTARTGYGDEAVYAYGGLDRAWIAEEVTVLEDDEAALARILSEGFDPAREVILAAAPGEGEGVGGSGDGAVEWVEWGVDERTARVRTTGPAMLVISENWFPGWIAEVDGVPAEVRRANLTLQAVRIPAAGEHTVTLRYTAPTVRSALRISAAAALATILLLVLPWLRGLAGKVWRRQRAA